MKTLILTTAMVVIATLTFSQNENQVTNNQFVHQGEDVTVAMYPNSGDAVTMILSKTPETKIKLVVKSDNDEVLYQKQFKKIDNTRVKYDISEFPSGEYTFEVVQGKDVLYSQKFSKRDGTLAIAE
ncbi:MAG TPA: hypothetical protein P5514_09640 [Bacteroidales bacterium]|nr:hypothetical protein [Bacteroidales bacterium]HRX97193.1 hypothetical protein [Bacteroidales bacterium]